MTSLASIVGQQFAFAHGRIGVLQQRLLSRTDLDRLLGAHGMQEAAQIVTELAFTAGIDQALRDPTAVLAALERWVRDEVNGMAPKDLVRTFDILWLDADGALLAYALKAHHGLVSPISREPSGMTAYDADTLRAAVRGEETDLPATMRRCIDDLRAAESPTPRQIDVGTARCVAAERLRLAHASGSTLIRTYVRHAIDLTNLRTALRLLDERSADAADSLLAGGSIPLSAWKGSRNDIAGTVARSSLPLPLQLAAAVRSTDADRNATEQAMAAVEAADLGDMWNVPLSVEPPFAFAAIALLQLRLLRAILIGKRNGLSPQDIKQLLPPFLSSSRYAA